MNVATPSYPSAGITPVRTAAFASPLSWGAIFAGVGAALALQVLFVLLGAGLGFAIYTPLTDENPVANLGTGAIVIHGISAVVALWFGGWVAGRFSPVGARRTGWLHGFIVWCAATVAGVIVVAGGAGWALGDLSKLVGGGLSLAAKPAAAIAGGATDLAKDAAKKSGDLLESFSAEALGNRPANAAPATTVRAKRELGLAVARYFNPAPGADRALNRTAVVNALTDYSGLSPADAERTVTEWTQTYDRVAADLTAAKNAAAAKARELADQASSALALFSLCTFAAFVIGAVSASCGGTHGARCALRTQGDTA